jgi:glycosyltransferase involved in cell wall biosynthesis
MRLTVLSVAYPLAPVGPDAVGGAEQILHQLDYALTQAGHQSIVVACEGSRVAGTLIDVPRKSGRIDAQAQALARSQTAIAIRTALSRFKVDVIHMHGIDFHAYLPPPGLPVLTTLHLPLSWYPDAALAVTRPNTQFVCVSRSQRAERGHDPHIIGVIENAVPTEAFEMRQRKRGFALMLTRVCPEKGVHIAIEATKRAGVPLFIAGETFGYPEHEHYFEAEVRPRLDRTRRFIGPVGFARKRRLLAAARCLLAPSLVAETSSLAAREAIAAGTPVVGFRAGALHQVIEQGRTGFSSATQRRWRPQSSAATRSTRMPAGQARARAFRSIG